MAIQADLRARILDDLKRPATTSWNTRVNAAIVDAISFYQPRRFYFNFDRSFTFPTVIGQARYSFPIPDGSITPSIAEEFYGIEGIWITIGNNPEYLTPWEYVALENVLESQPQNAQPYAYAYINRALLIYPAPNQVYTIHLLGHFAQAAPAADTTTGNVWMNEAFQLIRATAKRMIAQNVLEDDALTSRMGAIESSELGRLARTSNRKAAGRAIRPTQF